MTGRRSIFCDCGDSRQVRNVGFLLLPKFAMFGFTAAIECMRATNRFSDSVLYEWRLISIDGNPVAASNGIAIETDAKVGADVRLDILFVVGGTDVHRFDDTPTFRWLRALARKGIPLGAISTAAHTLARAGLLDGYRCTIHWENIPAFGEEFPRARLTGGVYEIDRDRLTCAGGTSALDLMLQIVSRDHGETLAAIVSDNFMHDRVRLPGDSQRMGAEARFAAKSPKLAQAVRMMERNVESPVSPSGIAAQIGVSTRQLERLFCKHLACPPQRYYLNLRLHHARHLLRETGGSVLDVALASGFSTQSHFAKCYREFFGHTPKEERLLIG